MYKRQALLINLSLARKDAWRSARRVLLWTAGLPLFGFLSFAAYSAIFVFPLGPDAYGPGVNIGWPPRFTFLTYMLWAVSYTHLDVYKRQGTRNGSKLCATRRDDLGCHCSHQKLIHAMRIPMTSAAVPSTSAAISISAARLAIVAITSYQALLIVLIFLRPDLAPSWHTISEWAIGPYGWIMSCAFLISAMSYAALFVLLKSQRLWKPGPYGIRHTPDLRD